MTLDQLLEQAHMDALGLLDPSEQAAFELAFAQASPAVKAQLRAEQARVAAQQLVLPVVEPSPDLRDRVLAAVAAASVQSEVHSAQDRLEFRPVSRVSSWWRVGTLGMATAACALGAAFLYVSGTNDRLRNDLTQTFLSNEGHRVIGRGSSAEAHLHDVFLEPDVSKVKMIRTAYAEQVKFGGEATILTRGDHWGEARLAFRIPRGPDAANNFALVELSADGSRVLRTLHSIIADGTLNSFTFDAVQKGTHVALVAVIDGTPDASKTLLVAAV